MRTLKRTLILVVIGLVVYFTVSFIKQNVSFAQTVLLEDSVNSEQQKLITDRTLKDACTHLMDCKMGTAQVDMRKVYSSAKFKKDADTLTESTLDTTNLKARFSNTATESTTSETANHAVWSQTAETADAGIGAFTSKVWTQGDFVVDEVIEAAETYVVDYAKADDNSTAINGAFLQSGGTINKFTTTVLFHDKASCESTGSTCAPATTATYTRHAVNYDSKGDIMGWVTKAATSITVNTEAY